MSLGGARIPAPLEEGLKAYETNDEDSEKFGIDYVITQATDLVRNGVAGLHICCMNRSRTCVQITDALGDFRSK